MRRLSLLAAASSALLAGRASGQSSCVDDTSYADPEGYTCSDWAPSAYVCSESAYSDDDLQALLDGCPLSCDTCTPAVNTQDDCADDSIFADEQGYPCNDWADASLVCSAATSEHSYSSDGEAALLAACPVSCETCVSADGSTCGQLFDGATGYCDGNVVPGMDDSYDLNWQECHDLCATTEGCEVFLFWPDYQTGNDCHPKTACTELQGSYPSIAYSKVCDGGGA